MKHKYHQLGTNIKKRQLQETDLSKWKEEKKKTSKINCVIT